MKAELRSGPVYKPARLESLYIPMQRMFKPSKLWQSGPGSSKDGKQLTKPRKSALKRHFNRQLQQIWEVC